jgi:predicted aconitase with swiveling domain
MVIYMEQTISLLGKIDPKNTQTLIDSGEIKYLEDKTAYLIIKDKDNE